MHKKHKLAVRVLLKFPQLWPLFYWHAELLTRRLHKSLILDFSEAIDHLLK